MKPIDDAVASYVTRHISPDGRTLLDLVWCYEPGDFRELGGQRRPRIYDNASEAVVLNLLGRDGAVTSHEWESDGALSLVMTNGVGLRVSIARGLYATSADDWAEHPLAEIQANAPKHLGSAERVAEPERDRTVINSLRRAGWGILGALLVAGAAASLWSGQWNGHSIIPHGLGRAH